MMEERRVSSDAMPPLPRIAIILGGGNALGAYHAGLYQALHEERIEPDWIVGTSIGAITGAIIAGNDRERRMERLHQLWRPASPDQGGWPLPWDYLPEDWRRTVAVMTTMLAGRSGMFGPIGSPAMAWPFDPAEASKALYDTSTLHDTLVALVDFGLLNTSKPRFTSFAVDIETGEEVVFDTAETRVEANHIRASAALLTAFPAVEIEGRLLADGGLAMNLPIDLVLHERSNEPLLCIAADLLPLRSARPGTLGEVISRTQDLMFAAQTRRTIERWRAVFSAEHDRRSPVTLARLAYSDQGAEVAGKAMDFSPTSVRQRWEAGYNDTRQLLAHIRTGEIDFGRRGLQVLFEKGAKHYIRDGR